MNGSKNSSVENGQPQSALSATASAGPVRASVALGTTAEDLDPRIHAFRDEIADIALADRIALPHYVEPVMRSIGVALADLRTEPSDTAELGSQLLYGEGFALIETENGWAWGYGVHDNFVGFVRADALMPAIDASHIVSVPSTTGSGDVPSQLYMGARVMPNAPVSAEDTKAIGKPAKDAAAVAEMFLDAPYLLGGRSIEGIDCSGLVQLALGMAGHAVQRDSDQQQRTAGSELDGDAPLQRGDLIFFPKHVGMMIDGETLIHASGHRGKVCMEPLSEVAARIEADTGEAILARRRIG